MGTVNDLTHDHIGDGINELGDDGKNNQKCTAPEATQLQNIRIVDVQVSSKYRIQKQGTGRAQQVTQPFFSTANLIGFDAGGKALSIKQFTFHK